MLRRGCTRVLSLCVLLCGVALCGVAPSGLAHADGIAQHEAPVAGDPVRCYSATDDVYCLMPEGRIVGLATHREALRFGGKDGFRITQMVCDVAPGAEAACLYTEEHSEGKGQQRRTRKRLAFALSDGQEGVVEEGIVQQGFNAWARGIYFRPGRFARAWTVQRRNGKVDESHSYIGIDAGLIEEHLPSSSFATRLAEMTGERQQPEIEFFTLKDALWAVGRDGTQLVAGRVWPVQDRGTQVEWRTLAGPSMYDVRTVAAADGYVYTFYHDSDTDSAMVATTRDGETWQTITLDDEESGWQLDAAPVGLGVVSTWYYMRNTYNKGLRTAFLRDGQLLQPAHTLLRNEDHNAGWCPHLGVAQDGSTWVTWWDNVLEKKRAWARLASPLDLSEVRVARYKDWRDHHKFWYLQAGGGGWYTLWNTYELALDKKDTNGVQVGKSHRKLANTVLLTGLFEARIWKIQLALGYAQSIVDSADKGTGGKLSSYLGSLKFDKLFPGHDVQVRGTLGHYTGSATPAKNGDDDGTGKLAIDTNYWHAQALALNKWRIKYGLAYAHYSLPATVHTFSAAMGQTSYSYAGSYFRTVRFDDARFLLGYSKLDYVARYENHYSGPNVDFDALVGASFMKFAPITPDGAQTAKSSIAWSFGGHLDVGWLWMQRVRALAGLGLYVRPLYRAEFDGVLGAGKPSSRSTSDAKHRDTSAGVSLMSVRHGPWLDVGIVW